MLVVPASVRLVSTLFSGSVLDRLEPMSFSPRFSKSFLKSPISDVLYSRQHPDGLCWLVTAMTRLERQYSCETMAVMHGQTIPEIACVT